MLRMLLLAIGFMFIALLMVSCSNNNLLSSSRLNNAAVVNVRLGLYYLQQKNYPQAKAKLLLALVQAPQNFLVYDAMGYFLENTGEVVAAEKYYRYAINVVARQRANNKKERNRYKDVVRTIAGSENNNNPGEAHNNYGTFLYRQNRCYEALTQFLLAASEYEYLNTAAAYENAGFAALCVNGSVKK